MFFNQDKQLFVGGLVGLVSALLLIGMLAAQPVTAQFTLSTHTETPHILFTPTPVPAAYRTFGFPFLYGHRSEARSAPPSYILRIGDWLYESQEYNPNVISEIVFVIPEAEFAQWKEGSPIIIGGPGTVAAYGKLDKTNLNFAPQVRGYIDWLIFRLEQIRAVEKSPVAQAHLQHMHNMLSKANDEMFWQNDLTLNPAAGHLYFDYLAEAAEATEAWEKTQSSGVNYPYTAFSRLLEQSLDRLLDETVKHPAFAASAATDPSRSTFIRQYDICVNAIYEATRDKVLDCKMVWLKAQEIISKYAPALTAMPETK
jgi:hypothetical protein